MAYCRYRWDILCLSIVFIISADNCAETCRPLAYNRVIVIMKISTALSTSSKIFLGGSTKLSTVSNDADDRCTRRP